MSLSWLNHLNHRVRAKQGEFSARLERLTDFQHLLLDSLVDEQPGLFAATTLTQGVHHPSDLMRELHLGTAAVRGNTGRGPSYWLCTTFRGVERAVA